MAAKAGGKSPSGERRDVSIGERTISLSNLDKVLWPKSGFTKAQAIDYYARIAPVLIPHLQGRPLTRVRCPNGVDGQRFYEKRAPKGTPEWVRTEPVGMDRAGVIDFIVCDEPATLVWLAQMAALELHPSLALAESFDEPTALVFDLDPGPPAAMRECCMVALRVRELFEKTGLECFAKSSGSKGIQVYVPLNKGVGYEQVKPFAQAVAQALERLRAEPRRLADDEVAADRQGAGRLEPEHPLEDDRRRLLPARSRAADGLGAAALGGGRDAVPPARRS